MQILTLLNPVNGGSRPNLLFWAYHKGSSMGVRGMRYRLPLPFSLEDLLIIKITPKFPREGPPKTSQRPLAFRNFWIRHCPGISHVHVQYYNITFLKRQISIVSRRRLRICENVCCTTDPSHFKKLNMETGYLRFPDLYFIYFLRTQYPASVGDVIICKHM